MYCIATASAAGPIDKKWDIIFIDMTYMLKLIIYTIKIVVAFKMMWKVLQHQSKITITLLIIYDI
jgi:hypothetical protein